MAPQFPSAAPGGPPRGIAERGSVKNGQLLYWIEGKFKLNQNHPAANRAGAISGLRKEAGDPLSLAIADLMAAKDANEN